MSTAPIKRVSRQYDTESPPSPSSMVKTILPRHKSRTPNPLNVYKADQDRKGASFRIILFVLATACYTAFLYSGAASIDYWTLRNTECKQRAVVDNKDILLRCLPHVMYMIFTTRFIFYSFHTQMN